MTSTPNKDPMDWLSWAWPLVIVGFLYLLLYHSFGRYIGWTHLVRR